MKSMTGFGRAVQETSDYQIQVEIKSVNQRFLDMQLRMPRQLNVCEQDIREAIKQKINRGRIELYITLTETSDAHKQVVVHWDLLQQFIEEVQQEASDRFAIQGIATTDLIEKMVQNEAFMEIRESAKEDEQLITATLSTVREAVLHLDQSRELEGRGIAKVLLANQTQLAENVAGLMDFVVVYEADHRQKFEKKLTEFLGEHVDEARLLTEMAILLERGDIHEELDRLMIHLDTMTTLLQSEKPVGRELDFLIQEMNREVNTIGSKSSPIEIKNAVVQMKTIIEKIREQVQNIE